MTNLEEARNLGRSLGDKLDLHTDDPTLFRVPTFDERYGQAIEAAAEALEESLRRGGRSGEWLTVCRAAFIEVATERAREAWGRLQIDVAVLDQALAEKLGLGPNSRFRLGS